MEHAFCGLHCDWTPYKLSWHSVNYIFIFLPTTKAQARKLDVLAQLNIVFLVAAVALFIAQPLRRKYGQRKISAKEKLIGRAIAQN